MIKSLVFFVINFVFTLYCFAQPYQVVEHMGLGTMPISKGAKTSNQDFVFSYGKTHMLAHVSGNNDLNILSTHYSNKSMNDNIDPILINDSVYVVLSEYNGAEVYKINNLDLELISVIGEESDENNLYSYELMSVSDSLLFLGADTFGASHYFDLKIYNINDLYVRFSRVVYTFREEICY